MSFAYRMLLSGRHIHVVAKGRVSTEECLDMLTRILADPLTRPESTAVVDLTEATYEAAEESEIIKIAELIEKHQALFRNNVALVARRSTLLFAELLSVHVREAARIPIKVFAELEAAEAFCREGRKSGAR